MTTPRNALRGLELTVLRRLDGILQGDHRGLIPGHGSEAGEARQYRPGDDVRRMDWNVTARTNHPHVRDTIADRELETTLVVDTTGSMAFGTAGSEKRDLAAAAAAAVGFLVQRGGNRVGAVLVGDDIETIPHRTGRTHLQRIMHRVLSAPRDRGPGSLESGLRKAGRLARRRGLVVVISDFIGDRSWERPLRQLAARHDVIAMEIGDPRELELPNIGSVSLVDPETGRTRRLDTQSSSLRRRYAEAAAQDRAETRTRILGTGADHLVLSTGRDWVADLVKHVRMRRRGNTTGRRP